MNRPVAISAPHDFVVRALARTNADLILVTDPDMNIVFISDANEQLFGRTPQSAIGSNGIEFINPEDLAMFAAMFESYERGYESTAPNYYRVLHEDGSWIRMEIAGGPLYEDGERVGWVFVLRRPLQAEVYASVVRRLFEDQPLSVALDEIPNAFFAIGIGKVCIDVWPSGEPPFSVGDRLPSLLIGRDRSPDSPFARAVATGENVVVQDLDELGPDLRVAAAAERFGSAFIAPVLESADHVAGLIVHWVYDDMPKADMLRARMEEAKGLVQVALSARFQHDDLKRSAESDALTGLANRRSFDAALVALRPEAHPALLSIDLDGFKEINDAFGHPAGDELLCVIARRLEHAARDTDLVARIGGDEFAVLIPECTVEDATALAERLLAVVREAIDLDGVPVEVGASVGVAVADDALRDLRAYAEEAWTNHLVRRADDALYGAKRAGRGRVILGEGAAVL
jgi:diguanylate cyclase (GGDEF)-like protein/PAS domain S-box-containing protein